MEPEIRILSSTDLPASTVSLRNDGILQIYMKPGITIKLEDAKAVVKVFEDLGKGKKYPLLFIAGSFTLASTDARNYASGHDANIYTIASAFVVNNIAQKLMGNAYISFNKPPTPTKIFTSETEAVKWLKTFPRVTTDE
ncbi:MAG: hypothetical protein M3R27_11105 [Bacteroidota bacterium]|nr:hypothetical protein [Bacteroidota bacterium]